MENVDAFSTLTMKYHARVRALESNMQFYKELHNEDKGVIQEYIKQAEMFSLQADDWKKKTQELKVRQSIPFGCYAGLLHNVRGV